MTVGNRIRLLRERSRLTQIELAKKLNIPRQNLSNYELGHRNPDYDTIILISDFFNVTTDYLLRGSPNSRADISELLDIDNAIKHVRELEKALSKLKP